MVKEMTKETERPITSKDVLAARLGFLLILSDFLLNGSPCGSS